MVDHPFSHFISTEAVVSAASGAGSAPFTVKVAPGSVRIETIAVAVDSVVRAVFRAIGASLFIAFDFIADAAPTRCPTPVIPALVSSNSQLFDQYLNTAKKF
jgi:hypothetical protein